MVDHLFRTVDRFRALDCSCRKTEGAILLHRNVISSVYRNLSRQHRDTSLSLSLSLSLSSSVRPALVITLRYCRFRYGRSGTVFSSAWHTVTWPVHFHAVLAHTALPSILVPGNTLLLVRCCHSHGTEGASCVCREAPTSFGLYVLLRFAWLHRVCML